MVTTDHRDDTHYAGLVAESRQGPYVLLHVEDSGIGIGITPIVRRSRSS